MTGDHGEEDVREPTGNLRSERGLAAIGAAAGAGAFFSAAACCVLPLSLAALGMGSAGLAAFVPLRWPLTLAAGLAVAAGWLVRVRRRRACRSDPTCPLPRSDRLTFVTLVLATLLVGISASWTLVEPLLLRLLGGV